MFNEIQKNSVMKLPELNCLTLNEQTTFNKLVEEIVECNNAICFLKNHENNYMTNFLLLSDAEIFSIRNTYKNLLNDVLGEIMDIAQVCASQLFVFEKKGIQVENLFEEFISEMYEKEKDFLKCTFIKENQCRYIYFSPPLVDQDLTQTITLVISQMGTIAQLSKFIGNNGEKPTMNHNVFYKKYTFCLFDIIKNCFNLIYTMERKYNVNVSNLFSEHIKKLVQKGYCTCEI